MNEDSNTLNAPSGISPHSLTRLARHIQEDPRHQKRLDNLRKSPGFKLIDNTSLLLKACQLDMDYPLRLRNYVREQLKTLLQQTTGQALSPDKLKIRFKTETNPEVDEQGRERYSQRMSLTDIGVLSFNGAMLHGLLRYSFADKPLDPSTPALTASAALKLISNARWSIEYPGLMENFWSKHRETYRSLVKLSLLDDLARQYAQRLITREGYALALDALGLDTFPTSDECLHVPNRGTRATVSMLSLNGQVLPLAVQVRSTTTSHCFIHLLGGQTAPVEYISDDPQHMTQKLVDVLNRGHAFTTLPDFARAPGNARLFLIEGDVPDAITQAHEKWSLDYLDTQVGLGPQPDPFRTIQRGLALLSAVDIWQSQPDTLTRLPVPKQYAASIMAEVLRNRYGRELNPDQVFIRYLRGQSITPLGNARQPSTDFQVPSETPISLSDALVSNYRVPTPVGYIDHGGRSVVYLDPTGKGDWSASQELPIDPQAIEDDIRNIDFLKRMTQHIDEFWENEKSLIEASLQTHFMTQALLCLKQGSLRRTGFDLVVKALDELQTKPDRRPVEWSVPGFYLQHSALESSKLQYCPSLLVLSHPDSPRRVFYQAGMLRAFAEFNSEEDLHRYLRHAARSQTWRQSVLNHVPARHHARLTYILQIWGGERVPSEPFSVLRPWTDSVLNQDAHQAQAQRSGKLRLTTSPFEYTRSMLKQNSLWDAQDTIVTSLEVSLRYWTRQLNHLQFLLAPMSVLLTPALIASLTTELGIAALNITAASLPGGRYAEKRQAQLSVLSLGLLHLAPSTPRIVNAMRKLVTPAQPVVRAVTSAANTKSVGAWLSRTLTVRNTRLEKFFDTDILLKAWNIPGHLGLRLLSVKAWKLQRQFLLWTAEHRQARTLVVSSHGYYLPWSKNTGIPVGTELHVYAPHGYVLVDPKLHRVVSKKTAPFALLDSQGNTASNPQIPAYILSDKLLAGASRPGLIKNYSLSKFQSPVDESYQDISRIVRNSNRTPSMSTLPAAPMDVLTIRNRFGTPHPTLEELFNALSETGIHYEKILLVHCRCSAFKSLLGRSPIYRAP